VVFSVVLLCSPEHYESAARLKVDLASPDMSVTLHGDDLDYGHAFTTAVVQSRLVLYPVITNLNLCQRPLMGSKTSNSLSVEQAYSLLRKRLKVQSRGTALLEIRVNDYDPIQAAAAANEIADVYRRHMLQQRDRIMQDSIKVLETEFQELDRRLKAAEETVERLGKKLNLPTNSEPSVAVTSPAEKHGAGAEVIEYWKALGRLEALTAVRDRVWMNLIQEKVDSPPRRSSLVEIIDRAEPAMRPSSSSRILAAFTFAVGIGSLALGIALTAVARWKVRANEAFART
jgi:uncharacterized protein involved in exopolysaccharide biosynthesis